MKTDVLEQSSFLPKHILVPVDFSDSCLHGLTAAMELAWRFGAKLSVVHVVEWVPPSAYMAVNSGSDVQKASEAYSKKQLAEFVAEHVPDEMSVEQILTEGKPFHRVVEKAAELGCDLIVVSTHGYTGMSHILMGSNAERIVQHASCPVLVMRGNPGESNLPSATATAFRWVLLPTDLSEESSKACPLAGAIAREYDAPLTLVHVRPVMSAFLEEHNEASEWVKADERLRKFGDDHCGEDLKVTTEILKGNNHRSICERARNDDPGLIVATTHGLTGWKHELLGSTAERIVQHASCPVLVVR